MARPRNLCACSSNSTVTKWLRTRKDKLEALHEKFPAQTLTLKGLASEEGSPSYNLALADRRREAVKSVLRDEHKHDSALLVDHLTEVAKGNIEYKEMRAVDMAIGGALFKTESIVDTKKKANTACTAEEATKVTEAVQKGGARRRETNCGCEERAAANQTRHHRFVRQTLWRAGEGPEGAGRGA